MGAQSRGHGWGPGPDALCHPAPGPLKAPSPLPAPGRDLSPAVRRPSLSRCPAAPDPAPSAEGHVCPGWGAPVYETLAPLFMVLLASYQAGEAITRQVIGADGSLSYEGFLALRPPPRHRSQPHLLRELAGKGE